MPPDFVLFMGRGFENLLFEKNLFLCDRGGDPDIDFGNPVFLLLGERAGRRLFFQATHGEFVSGFHLSKINKMPFSDTEKLRKAGGECVVWNRNVPLKVTEHRF